MEFTYKAKKVFYKDKLIQTYQIGDGEKVIFSLPSFPHSGLYYALFLKDYDLSKVKFVTFDLPGWAGWSETFMPDDGQLIDFYVDIAHAVIKDYGIQEFSLVGYSFGAAIAVKLASKTRPQIKKMVLVSGIYDNKYLREEKLFYEVILMKKLNLAVILKRVILKQFNAYKKTLGAYMSDILLEQYGDMLLRSNRNVLLYSAYQLFTQGINGGVDVLNSFDEILVINSVNEDRLFRRQAEWLRRQLNNNINFKVVGRHEDFVLKPQADVVKKVVHYLQDYKS